MKQEERRELATRRLLDTVQELVREKGCHSITMKDMAERSGLSKGAIFHYVKSKDEIFVWLLQRRLEETNERFLLEVEQGRGTFEEPMQRIADSLLAYAEPQDASNKVLMYLLGKEDEPLIAEALKQYYERSVHLSRQWIEIGQRHGVIAASVDAGRTAEMFVLMTLGLRMRSAVPTELSAFTAADAAAWMSEMLRSR